MTQRIPLRIAVDVPRDLPIGPGLSVEVRIHGSGAPKARARRQRHRMSSEEQTGIIPLDGPRHHHDGHVHGDPRLEHRQRRPAPHDERLRRQPRPDRVGRRPPSCSPPPCAMPLVGLAGGQARLQDALPRPAWLHLHRRARPAARWRGATNRWSSLRVLQAIGGGAIQPVGMAIVASLFEPHERGKALGIWGTGIMVGPAFGPTLGGYLTDIVHLADDLLGQPAHRRPDAPRRHPHNASQRGQPTAPGASTSWGSASSSWRLSPA